MKTLHVIVANKIATYQRRDGDIVCGNSDYQLAFTFDEEWAEYEAKTARFIWNGQYFDVPFTGDTCTVPVIVNTTEVKVGVYAGDLCTTTPASIGCIKSILCGGEPEAPEADRDYASEAQQAAREAKEAAARVEAYADTLETIDAALDEIIAMQEALIGGETA